MSTSRAAVVALVLGVTHVTVAQTSAQTAPQSPEVRRPYRGIFGGPVDPNAAHSLTFSGSVFAAYDDNVTEALSDRRVRSPWLQKSGGYQGANAGLDYVFTHEGRRFDFGGHTGAQLNYYRHEERSDVLPAYQADILFGASLSSSLRFTARQSVAYTSTYNQTFGFLLPEDAQGHEIGTANDPALDLFAMRALRIATSLGLTQQFGRYTSLTGIYHFRSVEVDQDDGEDVDSRFRDYASHAGSVGINYSRPMTRYATLELGYGIRASDRRSRTGEPEFLHTVDAGVNYSRALSFSRRTSLSFGTGSAIAVSEPLDESDGQTAERRTRVRLTGQASLVHEMGRTWTANLTYSRGFRNHDGFNDLFFTDAVEAGLEGLVTRRLSFSAGTSWANSSSEYRSGGQRGQSASAQLQYALTSFAAVYTRYIYYHYRYSDDIPLDERFPRQLDRHGVRIGLTTSIPLIR